MFHRELKEKKKKKIKPRYQTASHSFFGETEKILARSLRSKIGGGPKAPLFVTLWSFIVKIQTKNMIYLG